MSGASILSSLLSNKTLKLQTRPANVKALTKQILSHLEANRLKQAVSILFASPDCFAYSLYAHLFQVCSSSLAIVEARKVESQLLGACPTPPTFLLNRAIDTYGKCRCLEDAKELFDEMPQRDGGSWNAMIRACLQCVRPEKALSYFGDMHKQGVYANEVTFSSALRACGDVLELCLSRQIHGLIVKYGFCGNVIVGSSLVDVYGKCGAMSESRRIFDEIENPNNVTWNIIVRRYLEVGDENEAVAMFFKMFRAKLRPLSYTFSNALVACSDMRAVKEGMQIHGVATKINFEEEEVVLSSLIDIDLISWTSMVSAYAMSGRMREARELFDEMPERNMVSYNALLAGYIRSLQWEEALDFVYLMCRTTKSIDHITLQLMLNVCSGLSDVDRGKQVHGFIYRHGWLSNTLIGNALLDMYCKCGNLRSAGVWFHQMRQSRDSVSWNVLLTSYARRQMSEQAMSIFREMQWETKPHKFIFATLLAACANTFVLDQGKQIHGFMIRNDYDIDTVIAGALLDMYSKCRCLEYALIVFREADKRDLVLWNSMILGCCHLGRGKLALRLFGFMEEEGTKPDNVTFQGRQLHILFFKKGLIQSTLSLANRLLQMYTRCGSMTDAHKLFDEMSHRNCFSWNTMIEGFAKAGEMEIARRLFNEMPNRNGVVWNSMFHSYARNGSPREAVRLFKELNLDPLDKSCCDTFVLATVLGACTDLGEIQCGKQIHARILIDNMELDSVLTSSLINLYGKCGDLDSAHCVLNRMEEPDDFSLSALITGYVTNNEEIEAFLLFNDMQKKGLKVDFSTLATILSACSSLCNSQPGKQMHAYACKVGLICDNVVACAFIDAYSKCGSLNDAYAKQIFNTMPSKSLISWNSMIVGLSQNGCPVEALDLFCTMNKLDLRMNRFNLASVISACASISSLELGEQIFARATVVGLDSDEVISTSLVDFYCKCGFIEIGRKLFDTMMKSDEISWNSMLMGYATNGHGLEALTLFNEMRHAGVRPTEITFTGVLSACDHCGLVEEGWRWFNKMQYDYHIDPGIEHYSCMVDLFARAGCLEEAMNLIKRMPFEADASMWSSVLRGCMAHGEKDLGEKVAQQIIELDPENSGAYVQLSSIFATSGDWESSALVRKMVVLVHNHRTFIFMRLEDSVRLFEEQGRWDSAPCNSMISSYVYCGLREDGLRPFVLTLREDIRPTEFTFGVSINEGMAIFLFKEGRYGVTPSNEHYACLMDSLCRDGRVDQALNVAESMPCEPGSLIWESTLHSCLIHGDLKLSERVAERLMESEPQSSLPYLVLARINEGVDGRLWFELRKP
ncbi:hypothetical protein D5086_026667 [Populus alba]|uniref:Uncharacterized protein n=1 Tax=Populus alba TaxID=43335 RepID=A0ACC4B468_POPAL